MTCKHCGKPLDPDQMDFCSDACLDAWFSTRRLDKAGRERMARLVFQFIEKVEAELTATAR